jgi:hypothetical protein
MSISNNNNDSKKITFPSWKSLILEVANEYEKKTNITDRSLTKRCLEILNFLDTFNPEIQGNSIEFMPQHAYNLTSNSLASHKTGEDVNSIINTIDSLPLGNNEFYTLFDVTKNEHIKVDSRVKEFLGIDPEQFNVASLSGQNPSNPLFHPSDLFHYVRCGIVTYYIVTLPGFDWPANKDCYRSRFRVSTLGSKNIDLRSLEYVTLEKRAFLCHDQVVEDLFIPTLHLIRWSVLDKSEFNGIEPYFSSNPQQTLYRNLIFYLFNAYLIGLPTKYALILHLSTKHDRNKEIANTMNDKIKNLSNCEASFDEKNIADCFVKSIRPKMQKALEYWEKKTGQINVESDLAARDAGTSLSILPMPDNVINLICKSAN